MSVDARDLDGCNDATRVGLNAPNRARAPRARDARRATREESRTRSFLSRAKKRKPRRGTRERARDDARCWTSTCSGRTRAATRCARCARRARASRRTPEDVDDDAIERWVTARAQSWTRSARAVARMGDDARARTVTDDDARDARR